ncbi:hypothetical protein SASPL_139248 [Salvia splendens]|uniref:Uncharacterized protein n=1 Tax=Salvia splendens TaxID=180675 RepID=A0A8X8WWL3_SALSN|nr:hypothetical protein SASPL_139248 [Salvia splendens]
MTPSFALTPASSTNGPPLPASSPTQRQRHQKPLEFHPQAQVLTEDDGSSLEEIRRRWLCLPRHFAFPRPSASDSTHTSYRLADPPTSLTLSLRGIDSLNHNTNSPTHSPKFNIILFNCLCCLFNRCNDKQGGANSVPFSRELIRVMQEIIRVGVRNYMVGLEEQRRRIEHHEKQQHKLIRTWNKQKPEIERRVSGQPAQSASEKMLKDRSA